MSSVQNRVEESAEPKAVKHDGTPATHTAIGDIADRLRSVRLPPVLLHRPRRTKRPRPASCLNCGDSLTGNYCANCGQEAVDQRTAMWPLVSDVLSEFARWDSKFLRTLVPLMLRPGYLTNEYVSGKRASYLAPFRMFLSVSVLFFLILSWHESKSIQVGIVPAVVSASGNAPAEQLTSQQTTKLRAAAQQARQTLVNLNQQDSEAARDLSSDINDSLDPVNDGSLPVQSRKGRSEQLHASSHAPTAPVRIDEDDGPAVMRAWNALQTSPPTTSEQLAWARSPTDWAKVPLLIPRPANSPELPEDRSFNEHNLPTTQRLYDALQANRAYPYKDSPALRHVIDQLYWYGSDRSRIVSWFFDWTPKIAIILVPVFACLMYPLYLRTRRYYVEHLVFSLHNHTLLYIVLTASLFSPEWLKSTLWIATVAYMFAALKVVYKQGWLKTVMKFCFIGSNYLLCLGIAAVGTVLFALFL